MGALNAIKRAGLRIPEDIAIIGYDDIPLASHTSPALSTVRQPTREQGKAAAEFLLRRIEGDREQPRAERTFACELLIRESTSPGTKALSTRNRKRQIKTA
jgi:LacI family transcriptional regulator